MSNMLMMNCFILPVFCSKYLFTPPTKLVATVIPTLATAPVACPAAYATRSSQVSAAFNTSGAVNISLRLSLIPLMAFFNGSRDTSPRPALNPSLKISLSSFSLSITAWSTGFNPASVSSAAFAISSLIPKSELKSPAPPPVSVFFVRLLISSNPSKPPYSFAAFFALPPAAFVAPVREFAFCVAVSNPVAILPTEELAPLDVFPVMISVNLLNASAATWSFAIRALSTLITGVNTLIRPWPMLAFKESNLMARILVWFAQLSDVLAKSPCASLVTESK